MRRALVITNEGARHPFRQRLPRHVFAVAAAMRPERRSVRSDDQDWKLFVLSFSAFFTVAYSFIA
jgi:predicted hydrolase (HD superfamily)